MCEAWLDHIYLNKIKFTQYGALQLLTDFAFVTTWITNCNIISEEIRKKMLKNEVLRRCEGVGRLLLRSPGEHIKMNDKTKKTGIVDLWFSFFFEYFSFHISCSIKLLLMGKIRKFGMFSKNSLICN